MTQPKIRAGARAQVVRQRPPEEMGPTELAEHLWRDLKDAPLAERQQVEALLSAGTGETRQAAVGTADYWHDHALQDRLTKAQLAADVGLFEEIGAPDLMTMAAGYRRLLDRYPDTPEFYREGAANVSTARLRSSLDAYASFEAGGRLDARGRAAVEAFREVLRQRETGEVRDPGPDYLLHPERTGSLPDPLLASKDRGLLADGVRRSTYAFLPGVPVFRREGPSPLDVLQGGLRNCWMMSPFICLAELRPEVLTSACASITEQEADVRLFRRTDEQRFEAVTRRLDLDVPVRNTGNRTQPKLDSLLYAHPRKDTPALWPALLEERFAYEGNEGYQDFEPIISNAPHQTAKAVVEALTGREVTPTPIARGAKSFDDVTAALERRNPVVAIRHESAVAHLIALRRVNPDTREVLVQDPLGLDSTDMLKSGALPTDEPGVFRVPESALGMFKALEELRILGD